MITSMEEMVDYIRAVLSVSIALNEETIDEIEEAGIMPEAVQRVFKEEFQKKWDEGRAEGRAEGEAKGREGVIYELVREGLISQEDGARKLGVTELKLAEGIANYGRN